MGTDDNGYELAVCHQLGKGCGSSMNWDGYRNPELDKEFDRQSAEANQEKLQEDGARPIILHGIAATCWQPQVKGLTTMVNSIYNAGASKTSGSTSSLRCA
jgi:hypothetical protein